VTTSNKEVGPVATRKKGEHSASVLWWFLFEYTVPVLCVVIFYFVAKYLHEVAHAYEKTFYGADLLPLASVLILGAVRELEIKAKLGVIENDREKTRMCGWFLAMVILVFYAILRFYVLKQDVPVSPDEPVKASLTAIATFSLFVIAATGALCFWLRTLSKPID
jgi:hypothetical protein